MSSTALTVNDNPTISRGVRALSAKQERNLRDFLDEKLLAITGAYKKRSQPTTELPTLSSYLKSMREVLSVILQIPPVDPSTSLRTAFLLRLTGDALNSISGYPPDLDTLPELVDWLDDLDQAWICVLRSQVWDPLSQDGVDFTIDSQSSKLHVSQTERTRLRSLLVAGEANLEEWLASADAEEGDVEIFERLQVQDRLDEFFSRTLREIGGLEGMINNCGETIETC